MRTKNYDYIAEQPPNNNGPTKQQNRITNHCKIRRDTRSEWEIGERNVLVFAHTYISFQSQKKPTTTTTNWIAVCANCVETERTSARHTAKKSLWVCQRAHGMNREWLNVCLNNERRAHRTTQRMSVACLCLCARVCTCNMKLRATKIPKNVLSFPTDMFKHRVIRKIKCHNIQLCIHKTKCVFNIHAHMGARVRFAWVCVRALFEVYTYANTCGLFLFYCCYAALVLYGMVTTTTTRNSTRQRRLIFLSLSCVRILMLFACWLYSFVVAVCLHWYACRFVRVFAYMGTGTCLLALT